jgi:hypothetical protein
MSRRTPGGARTGSAPEGIGSPEKIGVRGTEKFGTGTDELIAASLTPGVSFTRAVLLK